MELLFKRSQTPGKLSRVNFELWAKIELDTNEKEISRRYRFDQAMLIEALQPELIKKTAIIAFIIFLTIFGLLSSNWSTTWGFRLGLVAAGAFAFWYLNEKRETIFVRDLLHGRHFKCPSVIELARKEAFLTSITGFLRQVMESAKHWDGTERHSIEPLPKDEARRFILKGI